jgi:hypothetical protein
VLLNKARPVTSSERDNESTSFVAAKDSERSSSFVLIHSVAASGASVAAKNTSSNRFRSRFTASDSEAGWAPTPRANDYPARAPPTC